MKKQSIAIVGNGELGWMRKIDIQKNVFIIGVDRGSYILLKKGITPDLAIGDFDSATPEELRVIKDKINNVRIFPADKDKTDLELAVDIALTEKPSEIILYGATGGRLDHEMSAFHLLERIHRNHIPAVLRDEYNEVRLVSGAVRLKKNSRFPYLSILPCSEEIEVSIAGCKYPLDHCVMKKGTTLGVSNVAVSEHAKITIHKGIAYCIGSGDKK